MPYADLKVVLRFSTLLGMYTFDEHHQFHTQNKWRNHDYDSIFNNFDFSLRATLPQIMQADLPSWHNYKNSIYIKSMEAVIYSNTTDLVGNPIGERSESERVFLWANAFKYRADFNGEMRE